jgi:membrane protein YdbS with pleckstrin-like domain
MEKVKLTSDNLEFTQKPSQWTTFVWIILVSITIIVSVVYSIPFLSIVSGVFAVGWICNRILISCWKYDFNERTVSERKGVFNVHTREIHYFRIKSIRVEQPFFFRMVGLSTYNVITSDPLIPIFRIYAIEDNGSVIRDYLKKKAIYWRNEMGVKETDFHNF